MNNNDKLEIIMQSIISKHIDSFKDINLWNTYDKDLKNKIIRELQIINSEDEIDYLTAVYLKDFKDDEPVTCARVSRLFNLSLSTSEIVKNQIIEREDDEAFYPENEISKKWLRNQVYLIDKYSQIEEERKTLIKHELEEVCASGFAEIIKVGKSISSLLKRRGYFFYNRSAMVASLLQYELGIHDVDCYKFNIDYHNCYGEKFDEPFSLVYMVSQKNQSKILRHIENECFKEYEVLKLCHINEKGDVDDRYPCTYLLPIKRYDKTVVKRFADYRDEEHIYIPYSYWKENKNKFIRVCIFGSFNADFVESMAKIDDIRKIDKYDTKNLNLVLRRGIRKVFDCEDTGYDILINNQKKNLTYEDFLNWLIGIHIKSHSLSNDAIKALQVETLKHMIIKAYYFTKYPEESYTLYFKRFYNAEIKKNILVPINDYEGSRMSPQIKNYHFDIADRFIGIFFVIEGKLVSYKEKLKFSNSDFIDVEMSHYSFFNKLSASFENEYSMFPRGRILYNNNKQCFYVYADRSILKDKMMLENIKKEFNLPNYNVEYKSDEHYKTLKY